MKNSNKIAGALILLGAIAGMKKYKKIQKAKSIKETNKKYDSFSSNKNLNLNKFDKIVSIGDSQGMNMNKDGVSYPNLIRNIIKNPEKLVSAHAALNNRSFDIMGWILNNITLFDIHELEYYSKENFKNRMGAGYEFQYIVKPEKDAVLKDIIKEHENTLVILSTGSNDLFHYADFDFAVDGISRSVTAIKDFILTANEKTDLVRDNIILDIRTILEINPTAKILLVGSYSPIDNFVVRKVVDKLIKKTFKAAADEFGDNVALVNVDGLAKHVRKKDIHVNKDGLKLAAVKIIEAANEIADKTNTKEFSEKSNRLYNDYLKTWEDYKTRNLSDENLEKYKEFLDDGLIMDAGYENLVEAVSYIFASKGVFDYNNDTFIRYGDFLELKDYFTSEYKENLLFLQAFNCVLSSMKESENTYYLRYPNAENRNGILYQQGNNPFTQEIISVNQLSNEDEMHKRYEKIKRESTPKGYVKTN